MKKRALSLVLVLSMLWTILLPAAAAEETGYSDVEGHYAQEDIGIWSGYGILRGYPDGSFRPDGTLTRAELAVVLDRIMGYRETAENRYPDVPEGKWYAGSILRLAAQGIYTGDKGGRMNPNAPITRQEAFVTLGRFLQLEESGNAPGFADDAAIGGWAKGYIAALGEAGYVTGDNLGRVRPGDPITRAEVVVLLSRMIGGFAGTDGDYSRNCEGDMVVNAQNVTLKDMVIEGNLIVAEGVAEGDVYLDRVTVKGDIILRGCGENSFHIMPGCQVKNVIVTKTTGGRIRLVNEVGETIPMIFVNDGVGGVTLDGGAFDSVVVACDAPVAVAAKKVGTLSVTGSAQVTVEKNATVARLEVGDTAQDAQLTVNGKVTALVNDAGAAVTNRGTIGPGSSSGSSSGGSSSGGSTSGGGSGSGSGSGSTQKVISEVSLQLLAPQFGEIPDTADVLGVGYTARTVWSNADGSPASYRWKASSSAEDTFTANQAYQAVITLAPVSGYRFADDLRVKVTDGKDNPTSYSPAQVKVSGGNRVVTMVYEETEDRDPVSGVSITAPLAVDLGETAELRVSYWDNFLVDPATYTYQWYRCSGEDGNGKTPIPGATAREYTIPVEDTQSEGNLYYCCDVMAMGRTCPSSIRGVEVHSTLDLDTVPVPTFGEVFVVGNGWLEVELSDLMHHKDMAYEVILTAEIYKKDGDPLYNGVSVDRFDYDRISDDGHARCAVDMADLVKDALFAMLNAGFSYDVEIRNILAVVHPLYKGNEIPEKVGDRWYDMTWEGRGSFHVFTAEDEDWQGPPKDLQLVIRSSEGTFVDKNDPEYDPVPVGQYDQVKASFRMKNDWVEGVMEGIYEYVWDGDLYIPYRWRDGFEMGESMSEVMCLFYAKNSSEGGMNVYAMKLTSLNIIFQSENE